MIRAVTLLLSLATLAQSPDPIAATLDVARADYRSAQELMKRKIADRFDAAEEKATKAGNTKMVNLIDEEKEAFLKGDVWGFKSINVGDLDRTREASGKAWKSALRDASKGFTLKRMKPEAKAVQAELDALVKVEAELAAEEANRPFAEFQAGTTWKGDRAWANGGSTPFELTISDRSGARFRGVTLTNNANRHDIVGVIRDGKISWNIVPSPPSPQRLNFAGTIEGDTLLLEFKGTSPAGTPTSGTARLTLKK